MKYLQNQGHEVKIIDYKPEYLSHHYSFSYIPNKRYDVFPIKYLYLLSKLPGRINSYLAGRKQNFDAFKKNYLKVTEHMFKSNEELKSSALRRMLLLQEVIRYGIRCFKMAKIKHFIWTLLQMVQKGFLCC